MKKIVLFLINTTALLCSCQTGESSTLSAPSSTEEESAEPIVLDNGNILFGEYPQNVVKDQAIIDTLNQEHDIPDNNGKWQYLNERSKSEDLLENYYLDVEKDGVRYRGLYFGAYRPLMTTREATADDSYQPRNGISLNQAYWFSYSPIEWKIIDWTSTKTTVFSKMILDSEAFIKSSKTRKDAEGVNVYPNNYTESLLREKLNEAFLNEAFSPIAQQMIVTTHIDNSVETTDSLKNEYACSDTEDKVFLLSYQEVADAGYGFMEDHDVADAARLGYATDYAKALGCKVYPDSGSTSEWWTRSPSKDSENFARLVDYEGYADVSLVCQWTAAGIRPAMKLNKKLA